MPIAPKALFRGAASTTLTTTLYTVPASTTAIVTDVVITNTTSTPQTFDLALNGVKLFAGTKIEANASIQLEPKQVLATTQTIQGGASATTVNFHISGVEQV
jgi:uncharacterized protein YceH (UPF0502 family)